MSSQHRNILFLIADDLGKYVGSYGCNSINTPTLDNLASQGIKFELAFASTASCSGSRSTIYTGLHTHENGQFGLNMSRRHFQTFEHIDTLPRLFNAGGYLTGLIGKCHVGSDQVYPWTVREESETRDVAWVADRCEAFFRRAKTEVKPFHLTVGFVDPHRDVSTRYRFGNEGPFDQRVKTWRVRPEEVEVPSWLPDLPETRKELVEYYESVNRMDQGVGFILEALERQGLDGSTLVVFTSDNGPPFLNSKTTLYDAGICLPLIVRTPGGKGGISNPNLVSFIDILPTWLDWAGLDINMKPGNNTSPPRRGRSFLPILTQSSVLPDTSWQQHVFGSHTFHELQNYWPTRYLRTRRYKYHRNIAWRLDFPFASDLYGSITYDGIRKQPKPHLIGKRPLKDYLFRPAEQLFDLANDPDEIENVADRPEYRDVLLTMRKTLEHWQRQTSDLWLYRDGCSMAILDRYAEDGLEVPDRFDMDADDPAPSGARWLKLSENRMYRPRGMTK